jgi:hypothetical protein
MKTNRLLGVAVIISVCGGIASAAGPIDAAHTVLTMPSVGYINTPIQFTIQARDSSGNNLTTGGATFQVSFNAYPSISAPTVTLIDNGDGTYSGSWTGPTRGNYSLVVQLVNQGLPTTILGAPATTSIMNPPSICSYRSCAVSQHMDHADLSNCDFGFQDLSGVNLNHSDLTCANLGAANLTGANLNHADLTNVCANGTNFSLANLSYAAALNADFTNANLSSANTNNVTSFNTNTSQVCDWRY